MQEAGKFGKLEFDLMQIISISKKEEIGKPVIEECKHVVGEFIGDPAIKRFGLSRRELILRFLPT